MKKIMLTQAHKQVVTDITEADEKQGFPKDGKNGHIHKDTFRQ